MGEEKITTVYVLVRESVDDYEVVGVFGREATANKACDHLNNANQLLGHESISTYGVIHKDIIWTYTPGA